MLRLPVGQHTLAVEGVPFSFRTRTGGWWGSPNLSISKSTVGPQGAEAIIYWTGIFEGAYAEPCGQWWGSPYETMADFASEASSKPGTELVSGPSKVRIGGHAAMQVVFTVRENVGCDPGFFYTWEAVEAGPFWTSTEVGDTVRIWLVQSGGKILYIEGATHEPAGTSLEREINQIVGSIRFD